VAPFKVTITKQTTWRGLPEKFSNVYHYDTGAPISTDAGWDALINAIVAIEKPIHNSSVTFVEGRVNGPTNAGEAANIMQRIVDLTGAGTMGAGGATIPKEQTVVCSFYIGRSALGYKRFLRKYYHSGQIPSSTVDSVRFGDTPLAAADKTPFTNAMNALKTITIGASSNDLCAPNGDHLPVGSSPKVLDHLHIRQLHQ
jgi:hypothetical protein